MSLRDVLGMGLGDFLYVDSAHIAEDADGSLRAPVPGNRHEIFLGDRRLFFDQDGTAGLAVDLDREDLVSRSGSLIGGVDELHGARLHSPAGEDLTL